MPSGSVPRTNMCTPSPLGVRSVYVSSVRISSAAHGISASPSSTSSKSMPTMPSPVSTYPTPTSASSRSARSTAVAYVVHVLASVDDARPAPAARIGALSGAQHTQRGVRISSAGMHFVVGMCFCVFICAPSATQYLSILSILLSLAAACLCPAVSVHA